ncbi:MAG: FAD:protein FMN transferase [Rhodothermales bacterium]
MPPSSETVIPRRHGAAVSAILAVSIALSWISCQAQPTPPAEPYEYTQLHLGVQVRIALYAGKEDAARTAARAAFARIAALEDVFSDYRPLSEVRRLTAAAAGTPVPVSPALFDVLAASVALSRRTDGAFDVTAAPLIQLWRGVRRAGALPDTPALAEARSRVGWDAIHLDAQERTVTLGKEGMGIDLGGIAKGYILDEAIASLTAHGIRSALVEAGGDLVVSGPPPGRAGWRITIPGAPDSVAAWAAALTHAAIATSGDTEQYLEVDGIRYSHVVDPRTGMALTSRLMATVVAPSGRQADSYATALTVLGKEKGLALLGGEPDLKLYVRSAADQAPVR